MFFLYSLLYSLAFLLMLPLFILRREKYASGFRERIGKYPPFARDGRRVIWLHCVSVGETNAARPLVDILRERFPDHRLVISTTTKTGQELARSLFSGKADRVVYFPFDWKFSVGRALNNFRPSFVMLMETEIWPRFIHEAKRGGAGVAIVNGRLSDRSYRRYSRIRSFVKQVLADVDLALMQSEADSKRITALGMRPENVGVTGNLKFDHSSDGRDSSLAADIRDRFGISSDVPLIIAASTHEPEEQQILNALSRVPNGFRLMIAPRHPQRFDDVARLIETLGLKSARRSEQPSDSDYTAKVILLDSIGELRAAYRLADIVFVGGSLIPRGGQSILEPAAAGKPIVTGPYTQNFAAVVDEFKRREAVVQVTSQEELSCRFWELLADNGLREKLGQNALRAMEENEGATLKTVERLSSFLNR